MTRLGWLKKTKDRVSELEALLDFFGVGTLGAIADAEGAAYRLSARGRRSRRRSRLAPQRDTRRATGEDGTFQ